MKLLNHSPEAAAHLLGLTLRETEERFARISRERRTIGSTQVQVRPSIGVAPRQQANPSLL